MKRIIPHWTAGAPGVIPMEADSYHFIINADGGVVEGVPVERNIPPLVNGAYSAHTANANSWSIVISVDAMAGAQERPFDPGKYPITEAQLSGMIRCAATQAKVYGIPVTRQTILTHAEVKPTLGIKQRQKWDIMWIPGMDAPGDPVAVGDALRAQIAAAMTSKPVAASHAPDPVINPAVEVPAPTGWAAIIAAIMRLFKGA